MTRVSKAKKDLILAKYQEYSSQAIKFKENGNIPMYEMYNHRLKAIRTTLTLLEIHILGINSRG